MILYSRPLIYMNLWRKWRKFFDNSKVVNNTNVESSRAEGPPVGRPQKGNRDPVIIFLLLKKLILTCCFVTTRAHCGPWTHLQLCVAQDTLVRSNYCIQLHSAPADTDYCAHLLPSALGPCLCADATVPACFCWLLHGILNVMRDYESESLR